MKEMKNMKDAILTALAKLSSAVDPMEMLLDVWTDAEFPCSFDEFCAEVARRS
jgi:hypothetical protein